MKSISLLLFASSASALRLGIPTMNPLSVKIFDEAKTPPESPTTSTDSTGSTGSPWSYPVYKKLIAEREELLPFPQLADGIKLDEQIPDEQAFLQAILDEDYGSDAVLNYLYAKAKVEEDLPPLPSHKSRPFEGTKKALQLKHKLTDLKLQLSTEESALHKKLQELKTSAQKAARSYGRSALKVVADRYKSRYEVFCSLAAELVIKLEAIQVQSAPLDFILSGEWLVNQFHAAYEHDMKRIL